MHIKIFLLFFKFFSFKIIFPFYKEKLIFNNSLNLIDNFINNSLFTKIGLGTPKQFILFMIKMNEYSLKILDFNSSISKLNKFDSKLSKTFFIFEVSENEIDEDYFYIPFDENSFFANEKYFFDYNNINASLNFKVIKNDYEKNNILGLKFYENVHLYTPHCNLIKQLKQQNKIENYVYFFDINENNNIFDNNNNKGNLIIGDYPHNFNKNEYSYFDFKEIKNNFFNSDLTYNLKVDEILFNNKILKENYCKLTIENNLIKGSYEFNEIIKENFFDYFIKEKKCFKIYSEKYKNYFYYYCNKNIENNLKKYFNEISFKIKEFNFTFKLNYKDILYKNNNNIYLLIYFYEQKELNEKWEFGYIFFKKYLIVFNQDKKTIGFYLNKNNFNNKIYKFFPYLIILICFIIIILLIFYIRHYMKNYRKKFAYELDDDFEYKQNNYYNKFQIELKKN